MNMKRVTWLFAASSLVALGADVSAATFYQYARVDLNATATAGSTSEIGSNPAAVAWNGTDAIIAGYNGGTTARDVALVKVSSVLTAPVIGDKFGVRAATPAGRGYLSLDVRSNTDIASSYDSGTLSSSALAVHNYDGTQRWSVAPGARPPAGAAFDALTGRLTFIWQGTNLLRNYNVTDGTATGTNDPGFASLALPATNYRDLDYDAATGNIWARNNNDVLRGNRTGATTWSSPTLAVNLTDANNVGENIAYLHGLQGNAGGAFAIYNDRPTAATGQLFETVVRGVRNSDLGAESLSFLAGDGSAPVAFLSGVGLYDFGWDEGTQTLAVVDYFNRELFVFGTTAVVVPEPAAIAPLAGFAVLTLRRRR
jgi:hypothetical protein